MKVQCLNIFPLSLPLKKKVGCKLKICRNQPTDQGTNKSPKPCRQGVLRFQNGGVCVETPGYFKYRGVV